MSARRSRRRRPSSSPRRSTTPIGPYSTECADPGARAHRALRVGRRLSRRDRGASRGAAGVDARRVARAVRGAARTSIRARCRSASTRSTPASAGSARTRASSTRSSGRGSSWPRSSAACRSTADAPSFDQCGTCTLCSRRVPPRRSSRRTCSTRRAASPISRSSTAARFPTPLRPGDRHPRLRLRRLPGSLSVESGGAGFAGPGLAAAARVGHADGCGPGAGERRRAAGRAARQPDRAHDGLSGLSP